MSYLANFVNAREYSSVFVLVDEHTRTHCLPLLTDFFYKLIEIRSGEDHKNLETCKFIWDELLIEDADRHSLLINLGGGVIGDMGGFCAAVYQRGIDFVNVPTTLLSMVDASVGGKTGIDYNGYKNYLGLFCEPESVFIHPPFLDTLPEQQLRSGYAEMLKHGLIANALHFEELKSLDKRRLKLWIETSLLIKKRIVEEDMYESGIRKVLNFGHTFGHAVESFFLEKGTPVLHGEAVAAGMILETLLSHHLLGLSRKDAAEIAHTIDRYFARLPLQSGDFEEIFSWMQKDKKNVRQQILFTLLREPGEAVFNKEAGREACFAVFEEYLQTKV